MRLPSSPREKNTAYHWRQGLADTTIKLYLRTIRNWLEWAVIDEHATRNPLKRAITKDYLDGFSCEEVHERRALSLDEVRQLLTPDKAKTRAFKHYAHYVPLWKLYIFTGMRRNELLGLTWGQVDLDECIITLTHHKTSRKTRLRMPQMRLDVVLLTFAYPMPWLTVSAWLA